MSVHTLAFGAVSRLVLPVVVSVIAVSSIAPASAQAPAGGAAWFGLAPPPGLGDPHRSAIPIDAELAVAPAVVPSGEEINTALRGDAILRDVETIVGFSKQSRAGGDQMWGRITGRPAAARTVEWSADRMREIGLRDVEVQRYESTTWMWWADSWEVRILGDAAYGRGSGDIVLESALPVSGSQLAGPFTAPLIYVGVVGEPAVPGADPAGKVAVQRVPPGRSAYAIRGQTVDASRALIERGAAAVINVVDQAGNMHVRDFSNCGGACFNVGGADGVFLVAALERARAAGLVPPVARLALESVMISDATGQNAVGVIPGDTDEVLIVNAHADGWFDAAGDNADGLAVLFALARHFMEPDNRPVRTLVFVVSGGHHSPGMNGPTHFVRMNPGIGARTDLVLNLEHVAQLLVDPSDWTVRPTEQNMSFGISNESPYLIDVGWRGMERYGFRLNPAFSGSVPGDLGGYSDLDAVRVQAIHSGPLYHTSGDTFDTISAPGLERAARFFAYFVREAARAPDAWLKP